MEGQLELLNCAPCITGICSCSYSSLLASGFLTHPSIPAWESSGIISALPLKGFEASV